MLSSVDNILISKKIDDVPKIFDKPDWEPKKLSPFGEEDDIQMQVRDIMLDDIQSKIDRYKRENMKKLCMQRYDEVDS